MKISTLRNKLTKLTAEIVKIRDNSTCQHCGKHAIGRSMHVSHVVPKSRGNVLRWDVQNLKLLCFHCHINWWHKHPVEAGEWFKSEFPKRWEYLEKKQHETVKWKKADYERMIEEAKQLLEEL